VPGRGLRAMTNEIPRYARNDRRTESGAGTRAASVQGGLGSSPTLVSPSRWCTMQDHTWHSDAIASQMEKRTPEEPSCISPSAVFPPPLGK
jgi:phage/plasmid primase-like uncharacterized protein